MTLSRSIVRRWMEVSKVSAPAQVRMAARLHLLDATGVGLAATALDQGVAYARFAPTADGPVSLLTGSRSVSAADAALVNGGLIHSLEFDDTHTASIVHGSAVLAPAALAVAQSCGASPEKAFGAYLIGYEMLIRIGLASKGGFQSHGFQVTSVAGTLIAALIACDLMEASEDERVNAVGIALSQASGVFEFLSNGSSVKSLHPGWAAHAGIIAARLATCGMTGPETAIEGSRGLFCAFARDEAASERLQGQLADLGARWHMADVAFKFLPCCHYLHPFVEAAGEIARDLPDTAAIDAMVMRIAPGAAPIVCEPWSAKQAPPDGHAARWSLPVAVAARMVEGKLDLDSFRQRAGPAVLALASRCRWEALEPNLFPQAFEAEITCHLRDGRVLSARIEDVFGNASRPASQADVLAKFRANAERALSRTAIAALEEFYLSPAEADGFHAFAAALSDRIA